MRAVTGELAYAAEPAEPPAALGARIMAAARAERPPAPPPARIPSARAPIAVGRASLATAAALALVLGLAAWNLTLRTDNAARRDALSRRDAALSCLASPSAAKAQLRSSGAETGAACVVGQRAYVVVDNLQPNDPSSVYVLWWQDARQGLHAVERFDVEADRTAVYELPIRVAPADVRGLAISLEPGRALPEKPTRPIASGAVTP
jgi:hypothetical protein